MVKLALFISTFQILIQSFTPYEHMYVGKHTNHTSRRTLTSYFGTCMVSIEMLVLSFFMFFAFGWADFANGYNSIRRQNIFNVFKGLLWDEHKYNVGQVGKPIVSSLIFKWWYYGADPNWRDKNNKTMLSQICSGIDCLNKSDVESHKQDLKKSIVMNFDNEVQVVIKDFGQMMQNDKLFDISNFEDSYVKKYFSDTKVKTEQVSQCNMVDTKQQFEDSYFENDKEIVADTSVSVNIKA